MASAPRYSYSPIESTEIRLLKFLKSDKDGFSGTLQKFSFASASQSPPAYTALSYVWSLDGTAPARSVRISIDGAKLPVLNSLQPFFEVLKTKGTALDGSWWWIDSICINQEDNQEKNSQVALMEAIYTQAGMATVWLGESSADSDKAVDFIHAIEKGIQDVGSATLERELRLEVYSSSWEALESLFVRRWWSRVWTLQEFVLPSDLSFWCGLKTFRRSAMSGALQLFHDCRPNKLTECPAFINSWGRQRVLEWHKESLAPESAPYFKMSLAALASYCSFNHATDSKDLLYGLGALTPDIQLIKIDYGLDVEEIYTKFTASHIEHYGSLDIICFTHIHVGSIESTLLTWVPDWRSRLYQNVVVPLMVNQSSPRGIGNLRPLDWVKRGDPVATYMASGNTRPLYQIKGLNLVVRGIILDAIDGLGGSKNFELVQPSESLQEPSKDANESIEWAFDCLSDVLRCLVLGRRDRYLQDAVIPKQFIADFQKFSSKAMQNKTSEIPTDFRP